MKNTVKISDHGHTLMVAHRGLSGIERENTCSSFVAAANRSYFGIETDVRQTADGKFVLSHDNDTLRNSGIQMTVSESTFEQIRSVRYKDRDGSLDRGDLMVPELKEYIKICKTYGKVCILELKGRFTEDMCRGISAVIREADYLDNIVFISFSWDSLVDMRKVCPDCKVQYLTNKSNPMDLIGRLAENGFGIDANWESLTEENVAALRENGITVNCWTVDDPEAAKRLIDWGVDQITTNILE